MKSRRKINFGYTKRKNHDIILLENNRAEETAAHYGGNIADRIRKYDCQARMVPE